MPKRPTAPTNFPFTAIVGQEDLKLAILLAVTDPAIGGVLVVGHRGTAKSTAVRALAKLLPPMQVVEGCPYNCDPRAPDPNCPSCSIRKTPGKAVSRPVPVIDLPLGATEDRVVGSVDIERALVDGVQAFSPGLLAAANRGFLYIDEVNLLEDHLVDLLLDVAASGVNVVEREGLSLRHAARFVLVGSGNPEEGDLRPQLLDRFGLQSRIRTIQDVEQRVEIVRRRLAFETDPVAFARRYEREESKLRKRLDVAIAKRPSVSLSDAALMLAARLGDRRAPRRARAQPLGRRAGGAGGARLGRARRCRTRRATRPRPSPAQGSARARRGRRTGPAGARRSHGLNRQPPR